MSLCLPTGASTLLRPSSVALHPAPCGAFTPLHSASNPLVAVSQATGGDLPRPRHRAHVVQRVGDLDAVSCLPSNSAAPTPTLSQRGSTAFEKETPNGLHRRPSGGDCARAPPGTAPPLATPPPPSPSESTPTAPKVKVTTGDIFRVVGSNMWPTRWDLRLRLVTAILLVVLARFLHVSIPFCLKASLDRIGGKPLRRVPFGFAYVLWAAELGVVPVLLLYGLTRMAYSICNESREAVLSPVTAYARRKTGAEVFGRLLECDPFGAKAGQPGETALMLEKGYHGLHLLQTGLLFNLLPTVAEMGYVGYLMFFQLGGRFASIGAAVATSYTLWTVLMTKRKSTHHKKGNQLARKTSGKVIDTLLNLDAVKYFQNEAHEVEQYDALRASHGAEKVKVDTTGALLKVGQAAVYTSALTVSLMLSAWQVASGTLTIGDVMLVNQMIFQLAKPLTALGTAFNSMSGAVTDMSRMVKILKAEATVRDVPNAYDLVFTGGRIDFSNVCVKGDGTGRPILNRVNFTVEPGTTVAVVGPSGCGKTTLVRALCRLLTPAAGRILVDGQDVGLVRLRSLRKLIAVVPQDPTLFNGTFRENIRYGDLNATDAEIEEAARKAAIHDTILATPAGYDTVVGPTGLKLSTGERLRVAIARALLKRAPILVLDEATAALDTATEGRVLTALREVTRSQTCLLVAHRLSNLKMADRIVVLNDAGTVEEEGTHRFLMAKQGAYYHLWREQERSEGTHGSGAGPVPL